MKSMLSCFFMSPLVSVITLSFNSQDFIASTVKSVLGQSVSNLEYLIIDGGSTDSTLDIVRSFKDPRIKIISEKDDGISDAMNKGIRAAAGKWIGIIHSDDEYVGEAIQDSIQKMEETGLPWSYGQLEYTDRVGNTLYCSGRETAPEDMKNFMAIPHPSVFVSKSLYNEIGSFRNDFKIAMDYDLCLRLLQKSKPAYVNRVIAKMRLGGASSKNLQAELRGAREVFLAKINNQVCPKHKAVFYYIWMKIKAYARNIIRQLPLSAKISSALRLIVNPTLVLKQNTQHDPKS